MLWGNFGWTCTWEKAKANPGCCRTCSWSRWHTPSLNKDLFSLWNIRWYTHRIQEGWKRPWTESATKKGEMTKKPGNNHYAFDKALPCPSLTVVWISVSILFKTGRTTWTCRNVCQNVAWGFHLIHHPAKHLACLSTWFSSRVSITSTKSSQNSLSIFLLWGVHLNKSSSANISDAGR